MDNTENKQYLRTPTTEASDKFNPLTVPANLTRSSSLRVISKALFAHAVFHSLEKCAYKNLMHRDVLYIAER